MEHSGVCSTSPRGVRGDLGPCPSLCSLSELCRINEDQKVALDLDPYVKKLLNARRRVVLVNNILQNAQVSAGPLGAGAAAFGVVPAPSDPDGSCCSSTPGTAAEAEPQRGQGDAAEEGPAGGRWGLPPGLAWQVMRPWPCQPTSTWYCGSANSPTTRAGWQGPPSGTAEQAAGKGSSNPLVVAMSTGQGKKSCTVRLQLKELGGYLKLYCTICKQQNKRDCLGLMG